MEIIRNINFAIALIFFVCYSYQFFYIPVSLLKKDKHLRKPAVLHRFAVLISARNEEAVIGNLLDSIRDQDYPADLVDVFVVADNCTDRTAEICRAAGATVWERENRQKVGKGYALDFLLQHMDDAGAVYDGYFVFDADNVLSKDYITEMNQSFSNGYSILTSYRNTKNFGDNWISAGYALWFLREARFLNNARYLLDSSCAVSGTGFLFSRSILKKCGGWKFYLLTEDIEFSVRNVIDGEKIGYCGTAVLYDEQPVTFRQSWRQRLRWAKGYLQVFQKYGGKLLKSIFFQHSFSSFDMTMNIMPAIVLTIISVISNLTVGILGILAGSNPLILLESLWEMLRNAYLMMFVIGGITAISEWKHIHTTTPKKILYIFTFPLFMLTYIPISIESFFRKVEWKPIEHKRAQSLREIQEIH